MPKSSSVIAARAVGMVRCDEHVRRLDVAMDDEVRVRVRDRGQHVEKQHDACVQIEAVVVAY